MSLQRSLALVSVALLVVFAGCTAGGPTTEPADRLEPTDSDERTTEQQRAGESQSQTEATETVESQPTVERTSITLQRGESARVSVTARQVRHLTWELQMENRGVTLEDATVSGNPVVAYSFPPSYTWENQQATVTYGPVVAVSQNASLGTHAIPVTVATTAAMDDESGQTATGSIVVEVVENETAPERSQ